MKRYLSILVAVLAMFSVLPVSAQQTQDALYIFRNDGGFNAFFFADIDHIEYSKIDTLGVEHADYVVQEVYALDSIFRIPISAIDSVAFVTPETKYRADAFVADASLVNYVIASDSSTWFRVRTDTPAKLLPKVGDKLLIEESCDLLPGGFSGKVTAVDQAAGGITVRTERISLTEVYEQYVWKFDGSQFDSESGAARRRADGDFNIKGSEKGKVSLSGARTLGKADIGPWESKLTGNADVNLDYDVGWDLDVRAFLHVSVFTGVQFDATLKGNLTGDFNLEMQGALTQTFEQMLKGKKTKEAELSVGLFLSLSAAIGITSEWKTEGDVYGMAYIHDYIGNSKDTKDVSITGKVTKSELNIGKGNVGKLSASTGLYAKAEFNVKGNNLTVRLELGGNVGIDHNVNLGDVANLNAITIPPAVVFYPADLYQALDRDATLSSYGYFNASVSYEVGKYEGTYKPDNEIKFLEKSKTGGWVPHVEGTTFTRDKALQYEGKVSTQLSRKHLLDGIVQPIEVGYLTLDEKQNVIDDYWTSYFDSRTSMNRLLDMLDPDAFYSVIPQVKLWGISMLTGDSVKVTLGPTKFDIAQRLVDAGREHEYKHLALDTNIKNLTFTSKADWLKGEDSNTYNYEDDSVTGRELTLEWEDMPSEVYDRRGRIDITGTNQKGDVILEDSVIVVQHEDLMKFTPQSIEAEAIGGTFTVNITETNLKDLSVSTESDFCTATLDGKVITVTIKPNTSTEARSASVVIKGINAVDKEVSDFIPISQAADGEANPGGVSAAALQFLKSIDWICGSYNATWYRKVGEGRSHTYYSDTWTWNGRPDKYDVVDTIMIEEIKDPDSPHVGKYKIIAQQNSIGDHWDPDIKQFYYLEFIVDPNTNGAVADIYMNSEIIWGDGKFKKRSYTQKNVPYKETSMYGDGVTNNSRMVEWSGSQEAGTLIDGNSSFTLEFQEPFDEECGYEFGYADYCLIRIRFINTIEAPEDNGDDD